MFSGIVAFGLVFPLSGGPEAGGLAALCCSEFGILVQSLLLSCRVSRSTGCAETTAEGSPEGAELDAEREFTSGPTAEGSADAAGRRFLLTFFRCRKKVSLGRE